MAIGLLASLGAAGCGRRGAPEPPPDPSAVKKTETPGGRTVRSVKPSATSRSGTAGAAAAPVVGPASAGSALVTAPQSLVESTPTATPQEEVEDTLSNGVSPQPVPPPRRRTRGYVVPKEPFILDPLL